MHFLANEAELLFKSRKECIKFDLEQIVLLRDTYLRRFMCIFVIPLSPGRHLSAQWKKNN